jgi:glutamyl/glutaminyl-tRNA synthetase
MIKGIRYYFIFFITLFFITSANAQFDTAKKEFNTLYIPEDVVKQLSYENFKRIKLLHTAIINYGGGKEEFDRVVDTYAEASALYFQNKIIESANLFTKNKKDIDDIALRIAKVYKNDTDKLHNNIIKMHVKYKIKMSIKGERANPQSEVALSGASGGVQIANDYFDRSKSVEAIAYYRRAKESCFLVYKILEVPLPEEFNKDIIDNKNQVYVSKEKKI